MLHAIATLLPRCAAGSLAETPSSPVQVGAQQCGRHPEREVRLLYLLQACAASSEVRLPSAAMPAVPSIDDSNVQPWAMLFSVEPPPEGCLCSQDLAWCS